MFFSPGNLHVFMGCWFSNDLTSQISSLLRRTWVAWFTAKSTAGMLAQVAEVICGVSKFCSFLKALNHPSWGVDHPQKKWAMYYALSHTYRWDHHVGCTQRNDSKIFKAPPSNRHTWQLCQPPAQSRSSRHFSCRNRASSWWDHLGW